ncbi:MAG: hypothetical protein JSR97_11660 [Verrucomicrobia bacterium]|nr:hypothetical protein [Verrucomicrobiota bacterium]
MSATITLAKQETTGLVQHINDVSKEKGLLYRCVGCGKEMIVVKSEARKRDWHFRHTLESACAGGRDTALHDYAVEILMDNAAVRVSKALHFEYVNPRKEVAVFGKRSDVTVKYDNEDVHFEVFVTHDLDQEKIGMYKANKIKCVRINLSNPELLSASPESIKETVLNQYKYKTIIYWEDEPVRHKPESFNLANIFLGILAAIGLVYLFRKLSGRRRR